MIQRVLHKALRGDIKHIKNKINKQQNQDHAITSLFYNHHSTSEQKTFNKRERKKNDLLVCILLRGPIL